MSKKKNSLIAEFKAFITRGNVVDLAVGVIIGGAFTAIVTALTDHIFKPLINWIIYLACGGNADALNNMYTVLVPVYELDETGAATTTLDFTSSIYIDWGAFISAIINFLLIAVVLFAIIKVINGVKEKADQAKADLEKKDESEAN